MITESIQSRNLPSLQTKNGFVVTIEGILALFEDIGNLGIHTWLKILINIRVESLLTQSFIKQWIHIYC